MSLSKILFFTLLTSAFALPAQPKVGTPKVGTPDSNSTTHTSTGDPSCAPGGNFDLSSWTLQLPIAGDNGNPQQISGSKLNGCSGYTSEWFSTSKSDGSIVFKVPSISTGQCVTTPHSKHCRSELREQATGGWSPSAGKNRLRATVSVPKPDDSKYGTVVGQIHVDEDKDSSHSTKPVCELYYNKSGDLVMGVQQTPNVSSQKVSKVLANFAVGSTFEYEIRYEGGKLSVGFNGADFTELDTGSLNGPLSYFKAGNYNQGNTDSEVHIHDLHVEHS
jgi:hypothetical protein